MTQELGMLEELTTASRNLLEVYRWLERLPDGVTWDNADWEADREKYHAALESVVTVAEAMLAGLVVEA